MVATRRHHAPRNAGSEWWKGSDGSAPEAGETPMHTATFEINIPSNPLARRINLEDIEMGMDADAGVKARASRDSMILTIVVHATDAPDAANWLQKAGLI